MYRIAVILLSSIAIGFAYNMFLLPHKILSAGVTGIAMIVGLLTPFNAGVVNFMLNLPILVLGYYKLGKKFIACSIFSVVTISLSMLYIPLEPIASDPTLSAVFGGTIVGIAVGLVFRFSASTGGFDIIGMLLTRKKDYPLGALLFSMNAVVVLISGFLFTWDIALYTLVSIYATGKAVDTIHTRHVKLTLMIITSCGEEIKSQLLRNFHRGITVMDGEGAYTKEKRMVLFTVISRYELSEIKRLIQKIDPHAFVNITETIEVMGLFRRD